MGLGGGHWPRHHRHAANVGRATEVLRSDLPDFFLPLSHGGTLLGLSDRTIYSPSVSFSDPFHDRVESISNITTKNDNNRSSRSSLTVTGRIPYTILAATVRAMCVAWFHEPQLDVVRMTQVKGPVRKEHLDDIYPGEQRLDPTAVSGGDGGGGSGHLPQSLRPSPSDVADPSGSRSRAWRSRSSGDGTLGSLYAPEDEAIRLVVRWVFEGTPRHQYLFHALKIRQSVPEPILYEGVFVYRFDDDGFIDNHRLQSLFPSPPIPGFCKFWWAKRDRDFAPSPI